MDRQRSSTSVGRRSTRAPRITSRRRVIRDFDARRVMAVINAAFSGADDGRHNGPAGPRGAARLDGSPCPPKPEAAAAAAAGPARASLARLPRRVITDARTTERTARSVLRAMLQSVVCRSAAVLSSHAYLPGSMVAHASSLRV